MWYDTVQAGEMNWSSKQLESLKQAARDLSIFSAGHIDASLSQVNTTTVHPKLESLLFTSLWRKEKAGFHPCTWGFLSPQHILTLNTVR